MKNKFLPLFMIACSGIPSLFFSQDNGQLIRDYISQNKIREYKKPGLTDFVIDNSDTSRSLQGDVVKIQQTYNGLPIVSSVGTALIKNNKIAYFSDNFVKNFGEASSQNAAISKENALQKISEDLSKDAVADYPVLGFFEKSPENKEVAKQRLVYTLDKNNALRLAYEYSVKEPQSSNYWIYLIDAGNGEIISKNNLTLSCDFQKAAYSHDYSNYQTELETFPNFETKSLQKNMFLSPDNASYNVFALPLESPSFGARSIVTNPWLLSSSPEGWHFDGTTHYTNTRGNNVYAYEDTAAANAPGVSPDGGASRAFDFAYDLHGSSAANQNAAITNLFYISNKIHDIFYKFGFTEATRNYQKDNFGKGGVGNDYVLAEAQDGEGTGNANFNPAQDGTSGRMQMYTWSSIGKIFYYNAPSVAVAREPDVKAAAFGPSLNAAGITGDLQLTSVLDGCTSLPAGSLTNKIGLVERGNCNFTVKVKNIQDAGGTAAVVYNNLANGANVISMGGMDASITIPSVLIAYSEGEYIKSLLAGNTAVNITLKNDPALGIIPDGSFDNGVVTHEYGHGISNRLTGSGYGCLNKATDPEQMGEGWSDFFALMLTNKPGDNASVARGMGTYVIGQPITGGGIRPAKYSPDFTVNDYTYARTNGMTSEHSIGFIWATMLWDLHWKYVEKYGYSSDVMANTTNGSSRVLQLVTDGLKLQVCNPTFIEGRNAILAADQATTGGLDKCMIWNTFAKRGLGANASAGSKTDINDQIEDFTVPAECNILATSETKSNTNGISIYPNPAKNEFFINFPAQMQGKVNVEIYDMSGRLVSSEKHISPDAKKSISTDKLSNGTYIVKVKGFGLDASSKVIVKK